MNIGAVVGRVTNLPRPSPTRVSYIAFQALHVYNNGIFSQDDGVYSPYYYRTRWSEVYIPFLGRMTYSLSVPSLDGKQGIYAATLGKAWCYMDEDCHMFLVAPHPDADTLVGTQGWRTTRALVLRKVALHNADSLAAVARLIIASHEAGYPQIEEVLRWACIREED